MKATYLFAVCIARFAADTDVPVAVACDLHRLATRAFKAGERECNTGKSADRQRQKVEDLAKRYGLSVQWSGLWPTVVKGKEQFHLPTV